MADNAEGQCTADIAIRDGAARRNQAKMSGMS